MKTFRSNGKLLLTGEYVVLDGAKALAIPTSYGQNLSVKKNDTHTINWKSHNELGDIWFEDHFTIKSIVNSEDTNQISKRLKQILGAINVLNPKIFENEQGYDIATQQDFNRLWGLGTSSTLITNLASWAAVDAFELLDQTFGGSGYDIACAQYNQPLIYQRHPERKIIPIDFKPDFKSQLYFVYLNKKQNSRSGISNYTSKNRLKRSDINSINRITEELVVCQSLSEFERLIQEHETIISKLVDLPPVKKSTFQDFNGSIKSLGAWGGDFVLATSKTDPSPYFKSKGFETIIPYDQMVLN